MVGGSNTSHSPWSAMYSLTFLANTSKLALAEFNWDEVYSVIKGGGYEGAADSSLGVPVRARHSRVAAWSPATNLCNRSRDTVHVDGTGTGGGTGLL